MDSKTVGRHGRCRRPEGVFMAPLARRGKALEARVKESVLAKWKQEPTLVEAHILFHWNDHSFFTYHQDEKGDVAAVVNLSMATCTDFHIAGQGLAKMESAGSGHLFPTKVFHRSGTAPRRCIKIVFFYSLKPIWNLDEMEVDASTASTRAGATEAKVKTEGKDATEGEETEDKKGDDEKNAEAEMETKLDQKDGAAVTEEEEEGKSKPETKEKDGLDDANAVKPQETTVPDEKNAE